MLTKEVDNLLHQAVNDISGDRVLICPLNWGIGHATRCVPIIKVLLEHKKTVIIAASGFPLEFLKLEFPDIETINFPGFRVKYSSKSSQVKILLMQLPHILKSLFREHKKLKQICQKHQIDTIISDNRFALWNNRVYSVYITHQLMIKVPFNSRYFEKILWRIHRWFIHRYDRCWIPDLPMPQSVAGDLTQKYKLPKNGYFIGILSRFTDLKTDSIVSPYEVIALVSGPEPQRSILENKLIQHLQKDLFKSLIIRGLPCEKIEETHILNITLLSHLDTPTLKQLLLTTPTIICRSGYSTLMDLISIDRKALLIPTPGQTEQEYLAQNMQQFGFKTLLQEYL